jgi:SNF2 family DNA or RNA helicase
MLWKRGDLDGLPTQAPKTHAALELIEEIVTASPVNKVVLFSFYKDMLYDLKAQLRDRLGYKAVLFTGDMNAKQKDQAKLQFQFDSMTKVFLSSDAGGYGVDLPQANYLINADLPWSAGKWDQRNARIIRLSSEFDSVNLIHILMRGSIEERQYETLEEKRLIASAVVDGKGADKQGKITLSMGTLREFLERSEV